MSFVYSVSLRIDQQIFFLSFRLLCVCVYVITSTGVNQSRPALANGCNWCWPSATWLIWVDFVSTWRTGSYEPTLVTFHLQRQLSSPLLLLLVITAVEARRQYFGTAIPFPERSAHATCTAAINGHAFYNRPIFLVFIQGNIINNYTAHLSYSFVSFSFDSHYIINKMAIRADWFILYMTFFWSLVIEIAICQSCAICAVGHHTFMNVYVFYNLYY